MVTLTRLRNVLVFLITARPGNNHISPAGGGTTVLGAELLKNWSDRRAWTNYSPQISHQRSIIMCKHVSFFYDSEY